MRFDNGFRVYRFWIVVRSLLCCDDRYQPRATLLKYRRHRRRRFRARRECPRAASFSRWKVDVNRPDIYGFDKFNEMQNLPRNITRSQKFVVRRSDPFLRPSEHVDRSRAHKHPNETWKENANRYRNIIVRDNNPPVNSRYFFGRKTTDKRYLKYRLMKTQKINNTCSILIE